MKYSESVKSKIKGEANEGNRRKELWEEIDDAYGQGGEDVIKSVLIEHSNSITGGFKELLEQVRKKL